MRIRKKFDCFMWFLIYNLPLILLLVVALLNFGSTERVTLSIVLADWSNLMPSLTENTIAKCISDVFNFLGVSGTFFNYAVQYVTFVILAHFLKIIEFVFVFFVHIAENLIEKFSRGKE